MSESGSHWILGVVYLNPDDPRVFVPMWHKIGLTLNFGHPRAVTALVWTCALAVIGFLTAPIVAHSWFAHEPRDLICTFSAIGAAVVLVRLNPSFAWVDFRLLYLASFGVLAAAMGFGIQTVINGPLVLWWGKRLTWEHHLVLGPVAALAQTFGKWFALSLLVKLRPAATRAQWLRAGLLVGLGFTIWEITVVYYFPVAWRQQGLSYLSLWERGSASMFHIYSAGLLAVALYSKRYWPIVVVAVCHSLMDFLAGAGGHFGLRIYTLETIFSGCAALMWLLFLVAEVLIGRKDPAREKIQPVTSPIGGPPMASGDSGNAGGPPSVS